MVLYNPFPLFVHPFSFPDSIMKIRFLLSTLVLFCFAATAVADDCPANSWKPAGDRLLSIFAKDVDPQAPLPEYPRPQMVRDTWLNLNGLWDYAITDRNAKPESFDGKILVPFPIESALSGVGKMVGKDKNLHYKRTFEVPQGEKWDGKRILLHFGAVDWDATVFVNGKEVGRHVGGYAPFCLDITDVLKSEGKQTVELTVWDPTTDGYQPIGKQHNNPHGIWYTPVTGIWQTVWLEPVAETAIKSVQYVPNIKDGKLTITANICNLKEGDRLEATASVKTTPGNIDRRPFLRRLGTSNAAAKTISAVVGRADEPLVVPVPSPKLWTPDDPFLYDLKLSVIRDGQVLDSVDSYFGMREISLGKCEKGFTRMMLNGKFVFQHGPLDQGWWPDGLYTAPTDKALAYDVEVTKQLGFNMLRKHVKVEPARFYYHCDRLGVLIWQDMPSGDPQHYIGPNQADADRSPEAKENFEREWKEIIEFLYNQPSIIVWVPFNEGWGQYDTCRILDWTKELDPTRLVDGPSGWTDRGCGDMYDKHVYRGPGMFPPEENRATVLGEYGGLGLPIKGHTWVESDKNWGYGGNLKDRDDLLATYKMLNFKMHPLIGKGLSAAVYTQTTDVEVEVNGLMTYDRIIKVDVDQFKASNDALQLPAPTYKTVIPTAMEKQSEWSYTMEQPADGWEQADFDASSWQKGPAGFGQGAPNTANNTEWKTSDIWIRKAFTLSAADARNSSQLVLDLYHDEDCEVYINGVKVLEAQGFVTDYLQFPMKNAGKAFKSGTNVIAIHCKQTKGAQYIDAGISRIVPARGIAR